ncbi:MAG TPA: ribonuclease H-like domain-containing protein [Gemmataceae bacterium]|nr:ribonuclease H-like domain-containing protein [Gemmataceae bacterium]
MLRHTFCHIPGIGPKTERDLWQAGLTTWEALLGQPARGRSGSRRSYREHLEESQRQYEAGNPAWFSGRLPPAHQWRYFADFRDRCAYLDIETTGMSSYADQVTTICLYDGDTVRTYVQGQNLDDFPRDVADYQVLVTYNGRCFDVPFLERRFGIRLGHAHIDLRYVLKAMGFSGGLKGCERKLGVGRPGMEEVDGHMAVLLWQEYRRHRDRRALETLLAYNVQDTVNLEALLVLAYNRQVGDTPFAPARCLPAPRPPRNPFAVSPSLVRRFAEYRWILPFRR